jgi:glucans biosynthesis protein
MRIVYFFCVYCIALAGSLGIFVAAPAAAFEFQTVIDKAKELAANPYKEPASIPKFMKELSYSEYQNIRFKPEKSLWQESHSRFQVMLMSPGLFYKNAVTINIIDSTGTHRLPYRRNYFTFTNPELEKRIPDDLGYAGFKLTWPLQKKEEQNQFMVFAGASYFRAVGRKNSFGLSFRGAALDTGLPTGEEFPSFVEYWLVRPAPDARTMVVYALLDSKSMTGAYSFTITPGATTTANVKATIFPRKELELLGMAPLTSMFYFGENTGRPRGEWRRQVHDSDGLLINNGSTDEWLWRPLLNPKKLQIDYFQTENVRGFGLIQRDTDFRDYLDNEAHYQKRPSAWVEPRGDWGSGKVVLVELPSPDETNDNIVAFWTPSGKVTPEKPITLQYLLKAGDDSISGEKMGSVINTLVGDGNRIGGGSSAGAYRIIVDFAGGTLTKISPRSRLKASVSAQGDSKILDQYVEYVPALRCWRLSILAKPAENGPLLLRAFLQKDKETLTETWTYRLENDNDIRVKAN